jgi:hypothetical protein
MPLDQVTSGSIKKTKNACDADPYVFTINKSTSPPVSSFPFLKILSLRIASMAGNKQENMYIIANLGSTFVHKEELSEAGQAASPTPAMTVATPSNCIGDIRSRSIKYTSTTCHSKIVWDRSGIITPGSWEAPMKLSRLDTASTNPIPKNNAFMLPGIDHALGCSNPFLD